MYHLLELIGAKAAFDGHVWAHTLGLIVPGLSAIPLDLYLLRQNRQGVSYAASPRRGQVLALLAGGILAFAIGAATALYAWITALFGSPIASWQQTAHMGLAGFLVGAILIVIYFPAVRREHLFVSTPKPAPEPVIPPTAEQPEPLPGIEQILDELLAGKISKDEAAQRLRQGEEATRQISQEKPEQADLTTQEMGGRP